MAISRAFVDASVPLTIAELPVLAAILRSGMCMFVTQFDRADGYKWWVLPKTWVDDQYPRVAFNRQLFRSQSAVPEDITITMATPTQPGSGTNRAREGLTAPFDDPEERRVLFAALDSFRFVVGAISSKNLFLIRGTWQAV